MKFSKKTNNSDMCFLGERKTGVRTACIQQRSQRKRFLRQVVIQAHTLPHILIGADATDGHPKQTPSRILLLSRLSASACCLGLCERRTCLLDREEESLRTVSHSVDLA